MKIGRILVPHDGEQMSDKALMYAAEFAKAFGAEIILCHVVEQIEVPATLLLGNDKELIARAKRTLIKEVENSWNRFAQEKIKLFSSEKLQISAGLKTGDPAEQILKFAQEKDADLIVMGSRRLGGASKFIMALGSVARKVSERSQCPVMLIH
ncbi:universal stress protein [Nitrososphaera sp.]|uniref:universal stress protein n=1 Tax=Nitrososphaera sp. TaxID=1971748 RepID=UPI00307DD7FE